MRKYLPRLLITSALLSPTTLYALGLGEIRLNSALNQPFDAEIELLAPTPEEIASLRVGLAPNDLFSRYGIDRPAFLSNFDFSISRARDGRTVVRVTSNRSVTEPFVTLLVEASWGRGRLLREYTVLLDPPTFLPTQPQQQTPVTAPQTGVQPGGRIERAPQTPAVPESQAPAREPATAAAVDATPGGTYTVQRNDTLWTIASEVNPGSRSVVNQTMIALFRANPQAFAGNINRLRAGSVLRIPDLAEIQTISSGEAAAEVARQAQEWSSGTVTASTPSETSRLRLVTPEDTPVAPAPQAPATTPTEATSPAAPTGAAGTTPGEDRRIEVDSPGLAEAQQGVTPATDEAPLADEAVVAEEMPVDAEPAEETASTPPPRRAAESTSAEAGGPSLLQRIGEFSWAFVLAGLALLLGLIFSFLKRRRETAELEEAFQAAPMTDEPAPTLARSRAPDAFVVDEEDSGEFVPPPATAYRGSEQQPEPELEVADDPTPQIEDTLSSDTAVRFDQQDALAEADFHMAYGLYDQAADLVKIAIEREPERRDLKIKLLEIYFVWGNRDLFLDTARDLHGSVDQAAAGEWDKVLIMGKQIAPEDPLFQGGAAAPHVDLVDVNLEGGENRVDVDLFAEPGHSDGLDLEFGSGERKAPTQDASSDLDFLLDDEPKHSGDNEPTREFDPLSRTQETPTIESPVIDRTAQTIREKVDGAGFAKLNTADQTGELSIDDLGLDVDGLEATGSLEDTTSLDKDPSVDTMGIARPLGDDEMTQLAPSLGSFDRTLHAPRPDVFDIESTGTIYVDQVDLSGHNDTVEQPRPDVDATASLRPLDIDLDLGEPNRANEDATVRADDASFADVFAADNTTQVPPVDLDVGDALTNDDVEPTNRQELTNEMELSELEPVTMSEVGTKLDLARAYMDMGDPDGARSILEEVLHEGNASQKQEAQRLIDSIR